jgi:uncharacterized protein (DUF433 family)
VFTDGNRVFAAVEPGAQADQLLIELSPRRHAQVVWGDVLAPFLQEIEFDPISGAAERWWPLGKQVPVVLDPRVAFGAPVIQGTALRTAEAARMARKVSVAEVGDAFDLPTERIAAAVEFENLLAAA